MKADNDNQPIRIGPWLPTKTAAKAVGAKHFYTGIECKNGHIAPRLTSNGVCMDCHNTVCGERNKMKRALDEEWREETNAKARARWAKNPQSGYEAHKRWVAANQEKHREYGKLYMRQRRAEDPTITEAERNRVRERRKDDAYVERERAKGRAIYAENPDKFRAKSKRYAKENPEVAATHARNRRALLRATEGTHTPADIDAILRRQKYKCAECGVSLKDGYDVDHIMPLTKGGSNWPSNLQCLCKTCNLKKTNLHPVDFARRQGRLL